MDKLWRYEVCPHGPHLQSHRLSSRRNGITNRPSMEREMRSGRSPTLPKSRDYHLALSSGSLTQISNRIAAMIIPPLIQTSLVTKSTFSFVANSLLSQQNNCLQALKQFRTSSLPKPDNHSNNRGRRCRSGSESGRQSRRVS